MKTTLNNITNDNNNILVKTEPLPSTIEKGNFPLATSNQSSAGSAVTTTSTSNVPKRPAFLDLKQSTRKQQQLPSPLLIESQNNQSVKTLGTPDLEKILHLLPTPQPGRLFPTKTLSVTSEQEAFGKGFEEALHSLHNSKIIQSKSNSASCGSTVTNDNILTATTTGMSGGTFTYTNLENFPITVKDEPQSIPINESAPVSRIDMEAQEKIKLERKRQRNRVAASKCRKRKLERISKLEEKVKILKGENNDLGLIVKNLKEHVAQLKQQVIDHIESGCSIQTICNSASSMLSSK